MSVEFTELLKSELAAVMRELEDVRAQEEAIKAEAAERLRCVSETATRLQARMRHIQALLALEGQPMESGAVGSEAVSSAPRVGSLADAAYELLAETRQEYHYEELAAQLELRGVHIPGKEPAKNLVAHIHRDSRFVRPKRGVYGLREWYPKGTVSVGVRRRRTRGKSRAGASTRR
ncbi:MAG: winged helix-turn-helix domain-containing protein [Dehalococcoidia bacterium]